MLLLFVTTAVGAEWEPQPWSSPVLGASAAKPAGSLSTGLFEGWYRWYRRRSVSNGGGCPYYPTCSAFGILAIRNRGPVRGVLLTVDRLFREYPGMENLDHYPIVMPHGTPRLFDPPPGGLP